MPIYEITDRQSYVHPMHDYGFGADTTTKPETTVTDLVMTKKEEESTDWMSYLSPLIAGVVMSIFSYGIARKFKVEPSKARGMAITIGGITALGHGLSNWLFKTTEPIRQQMPTATAPTATTSTTTK